MGRKIRLYAIGILAASLVMLLVSCGKNTQDEKSRLLLNNSNMTMKVGDAVNLQAFYEENREIADVTWSSDDISVVAVTGNGRVDAVGKGRAVITAMDEDGVQARCDISVKDIEVESIKLSKIKASVKAKESIQIQADIYPEEASNKDLQWISEDDDIAVVNSSGLVTGKEAGTINIICRSANGKEASCTVVVKGSGSLADTANTASTSRPGGSYTNVQNSDNDTYQEESFYGIWCGASKSRDDAEKKAESFRDKGLDAQVFITTDWSNLNKEKWYVISAGVYDSKSDAEVYLPAVKKIYSGAYVKYSGKWQG